jgi:hypothetical protein
VGEGAGEQLPLARHRGHHAGDDQPCHLKARPQPEVRLFGAGSAPGCAPAPLAFDTMLAEWLCDPASQQASRSSLPPGIEMTEIK